MFLTASAVYLRVSAKIATFSHVVAKVLKNGNDEC